MAVAHVSNALGTVNPVREIVRAGPRRGRRRCWSTARRRCRTCAVDVQALGCDFYAFSGHKVYGPTGIGVLYGKRERCSRPMPPWQGGGDMIPSVTFERTTCNELPYKFEAGTPNIAGAIGLGAAIDYVERARARARSRAHEHELLELRDARLADDPGPAPHRHGAGTRPACSRSSSRASTRTTSGTILDHEGIAVRTGHHCAQPVMERFGVPATARASLAFYNTTRGGRRARRAASARSGRCSR